MPETPFWGLLLPLPWLICYLLPLVVYDRSSTFSTPSLELSAPSQRMPSGGVGSLVPMSNNVYFILLWLLIHSYYLSCLIRACLSCAEDMFLKATNLILSGGVVLLPDQLQSKVSPHYRHIQQPGWLPEGNRYWSMEERIQLSLHHLQLLLRHNLTDMQWGGGGNALVEWTNNYEGEEARRAIP